MKFRTSCYAAATACLLACYSGAGVSAAEDPSIAAAPQPSANSQPPALDLLALSPDGKHLAFVSRTPYAIVVVDTAGAVQTALAISDTRITDLQWVDDTRLLSVRTGYQAVGDVLPTQLLHQAVVYDIVQKKLRMPLNELAGTVAVVADGALMPGSWKDRRTLFMTAWSVGGEQPNKSLFRYDLDNGRSFLLDQGSFDSGEWAVTPTGELLAKTTYDPSTDKWTLFSRSAGQWKAIRTETTTRPMILEGQGRSDGTIVLSPPDDLVESSADAQGKGVSVAPPDAIVEHSYFERATGRLVGLRLAGEPPAYAFFDPDLKKAWSKTLRAFKGKRVRLIDFSADKKTLAVEVNENGGPGEAYLIQIATGQANLLGAERPDFKPEQVGKVAKVAYTARDGLPIVGYLTTPPGLEAKNLPLLVIVGSAPDAVAGLGFDPEAQFFAAKGYAVFQPNVRGSTSSTRTFRDAGLGQLGKAMQTDIVDGVNHLIRTGAVNGARVCIMGQEYGGYAAVAAVTVQKQAWRCAVAYRGDFDLVDSTKEDPKLVRGTGWRHRSLQQRYIAGDGRPTMDQVNAIAPVAHAAEATAPILMILPDKDQAGREHAMRLHAALDEAHKPNAVTVLKKTTSLVDPSAVDRLWSAELDFLVKNNPPG